MNTPGQAILNIASTFVYDLRADNIDVIRVYASFLKIPQILSCLDRDDCEILFEIKDWAKKIIELNLIPRDKREEIDDYAFAFLKKILNDTSSYVLVEFMLTHMRYTEDQVSGLLNLHIQAGKWRSDGLNLKMATLLCDHGARVPPLHETSNFMSHAWKHASS
jgi:hypothetical protein